MHPRAWVHVLVVVAALCACSPAKDDFKTQVVHASDYGSRWPLTVETAVLACKFGVQPTVTVNGNSYALDSTDEEDKRLRPTMRWLGS